MPPSLWWYYFFFQESFDCSSESSGSPFIPPSYNDLVIKPTFGKGDTAHITMSRRSDVGSVQGRYDLRDLVRLELANQSYDEYKMTSGLARCYGDGQWAVYLNEPIDVNALFTGFYWRFCWLLRPPYCLSTSALTPSCCGVKTKILKLRQNINN